MRSALSVPAVAIFVSATGFGGLAQSLGWPLLPALFSTLVVYALPGQFVFIGALAAGASLLAAAFAVTLSAVRLLPMTVVLLPLIRSPRTSMAQLVAASHFVAMTGWLEGFRLLPGVPSEGRYRFFLGLSGTLMIVCLSGTGIGYLLVTELPLPFAVGLVAVTPLYFLYSLEKGARGGIDRLAIVLGFLLGIAAVYVAPGFELLLAGVVGGTVAFVLERSRARRAGAS